MKSLAIWYKKKGNDQKYSDTLELHINIWKLPSKKNFKRFIDIGLMVKNVSDIDGIYIYYPENIDSENIQDLFHTINDSSSIKLISTIFNENLVVSDDQSANYKIVTYKNDSQKTFIFYELTNSIYSTKNDLNGTIIDLNLSKLNETRPIYLRFRINHDFHETFGVIESPPNSILQSAFSKNELFDIRINDLREMSNNLVARAQTSESDFFSFSKIHVFYICSMREELKLSHIPPESIRRLESDKWENYIYNSKSNNSQKKSINSKTLLAYHFKKKEKENNSFSDYNALIQTKYEHNNGGTILKNLLVLLLLTIIFNLFSSSIYDCIKSCITKNPDTTEKGLNKK